MNRLHKPHEIMCYAAIVAAVPLLAKFVEVASGSELPQRYGILHGSSAEYRWLLCVLAWCISLWLYL